MVQSLKVGKLVYNRLSSLVSNRCYPLVAENGTSFPFIIYQREGLTSMLCKDGAYEDEVTVTIKVVDDTYNGSITLAQSVREQMTFNNLHYSENTDTVENIYSSQLVQADESFEDNSYVQTLVFQIDINN